MLYGGFEEGQGIRVRSGLYTNLLNPLRGDDTKPSSSTRSQNHFSGNGPPVGHNAMRVAHRQLQPGHYGRLPAINPNNPYVQSLLGPPSLPAGLEAKRPKHSEGPQNLAELARLKYLEAARKVPPEMAWIEHQKNQRNWQAQQRYLGELEKFKQSPLVANISRNPDLNMYERASLGLEAASVDELRMMRALPVGTDLYRYKVEQTKEMATARGEVLKLIEEQRLKEMKKQYDIKTGLEDRRFEDQFWADDQMKNIIQKQLRQIMGKDGNVVMERGNGGGGQREE